MSAQKFDPEVEGQPAAPLAKTYEEWRTPFPGGAPTVKIIYHGLFCFFFDGRNRCFAGTHNTTRRPGKPHTDHPHEYVVTIEQRDGGIITRNDKFKVNNGDPLDVSLLNFNVQGAVFPGAVPPGVYVYTGPRYDQFTRDDADDPQDWRWIIDFEDKMYPAGVKGKNKAAMEPGITVNNGLFHTNRRTHAHFELRPEAGGGAPIILNSVAEVMAANIYLAAEGFVGITGGPVGERRLDFAPNRTFRVNILNLCDGNANASCDYHSVSLDKKRRNDFFLHYETFDPEQNQPEYMLINRGGRDEATDDAPCGGVGYSGSTPP
jgi:hypothetical protein